MTSNIVRYVFILMDRSIVVQSCSEHICQSLVACFKLDILMAFDVMSPNVNSKVKLTRLSDFPRRIMYILKEKKHVGISVYSYLQLQSVYGEVIQVPAIYIGVFFKTC